MSAFAAECTVCMHICTYTVHTSHLNMCGFRCVSDIHESLHYFVYNEYMTVSVCVGVSRCLLSHGPQPLSSHQYSPGFQHAGC